MLDIAVRRLRTLPIRHGTGVSPAESLVVRTELARLGIAVEGLALESVHPSWLEHWPTIARTLSEMRGDHVDYVPLFLDFPEDVPDDDERLMRRMLGYLGFDTFDPSKFGANPITQRYDADLFARALASQSTQADGRVETLTLETMEMHHLDDAFAEWASRRIESRSSIPEVEHADLQRILVHLGPDRFDLERIGQKETAALVLGCFWRAGQLDAVASLAKTPTDLLRLFASLTETDVSLTEEVKFPRFSRSQRRCVLSVLEKAPALGDDLLRYPRLWKHIARSLHSRSYGKRFPRAVEALQQLRHGELRSWESGVEQKIARRDGTVLELLATRPGSFARRLHQLLRTIGIDSTLAVFERIAHQVPSKILLSLHTHFATIEYDERRAIVTKKGRIKVLKNPHLGALGNLTTRRILELLEKALIDVFSDKSSWEGKSVWLHPRLDQYTVPLQLRSASDGLINVGRGSKIPMGDVPCIRLFVWWRQKIRDTDLDLSAVLFDEDYRYLGHVSYTQLSGYGMAHSGDLVSTGPEGATEFIDIDPQCLPANARYIAPQIHRYAGDPLQIVEAHAGWMLRNEVSSSFEGFDPATVKQKFVVSGAGSYAVPFLLDVRTFEVVFVDLYIGKGALQSRVETSHNGLADAVRSVADFTRTRPNLRMLAELHVKARGGTLVDEPDADITFGIDSGTFQAEDPVGCLASLL